MANGSPCVGALSRVGIWRDGETPLVRRGQTWALTSSPESKSLRSSCFSVCLWPSPWWSEHPGGERKKWLVLVFVFFCLISKLGN